MASKLNPYLNFNGTAREALTFYAGVFGGDATFSTFGEFGPPDAASSPDADKIMHGQLITPAGYTIMGADVPEHLEYQAPGGTTSSLSGDDADELRGYWEGLADGATVTVPLEKQMWGDEFGMLIDRFGQPWMVNIVAAG
jgi:PhnB protein